MAQLLPLPDDLARRTFTREQLRDAGVSDRERDGPLWRRAFHDRYVWASTDGSHPRQRIRAAASVLPAGAAIGGWAAAYLHGANELDGVEAATRALVPVPLCVGPGDRIRPRPGLHLLRSQLDDADIVVVDGIPVTSPVRTAYDIGRGAGGRWRGLPSVRRLMNTVADVDATLRDTRTGADAVARYSAARPHWRGTPLLQRVLGLADPRAASRPESAFRVVWVVAARMPRPKVNWPIYAADGQLLAIVDLLDEEAGLGGEYDGADHRGLDQHTRDNVREELLEHHNLVIVRATSIDLYRRPVEDLVARIRSGRRRGLARDRRRDRWQPGSRPLH